MRRILIVGATSAIAEATARIFAEEGDALFLVGRNETHLAAIADDLRARGAGPVSHHVMDVNDTDAHATMFAGAEQALGSVDVVLVAHGTLPDQEKCESDVALTLQEIRTNALATIALLTPLAETFEARQHGTIAVISSVAGDRGRQSNYVYGTAKAAIDAFLEGLRQRLHKSGVRVVTIKPGFIETPMTAAFDKGFLWAQPAGVARLIHRAIVRGRDVVYVPRFWRPIMIVIRLIPRSLFKIIKL